MAIYYNGQSISLPAYNSQNISAAYYNGNLVFSGSGDPSYLGYFNFYNASAASFTTIPVYLKNSTSTDNLISVSGLNTYLDPTTYTLYSDAKKLKDIYLNKNCYQLCNNLRNVTDFSNIIGMNWSKVTNAAYMFRSCYNLNQNIQIPNSVTDAASMFRSCYNLNQNIQIPNSVTDASYMFFQCYNLNQNIHIPNSVTNAFIMFSHCHNLNQNIHIPNSVINAYSMFSFCLNLNQNIHIPNSVINAYSMFAGCYNLKQNIQIPNSVTNTLQMFGHCYNLSSGKNLTIYNINRAWGIYDGCINVIKSLTTIICPINQDINKIWLPFGYDPRYGTYPNYFSDNAANYNIYIAPASENTVYFNLYDNVFDKVWYNKIVPVSFILPDSDNIGISWT